MSYIDLSVEGVRIRGEVQWNINNQFLTDITILSVGNENNLLRELEELEEPDDCIERDDKNIRSNQEAFETTHCVAWSRCRTSRDWHFSLMHAQMIDDRMLI